MFTDITFHFGTANARPLTNEKLTIIPTRGHDGRYELKHETIALLNS